MKFQTILPSAILVLSSLSAVLSLPIGDTTATPPPPALLPIPPNPASPLAPLGGTSAQGQAQGHLLKLRAQLQGQLHSGGDDNGGLARAMGDMFARVLQQAAADGSALVGTGGGSVVGDGLWQGQRAVAVGQQQGMGSGAAGAMDAASGESAAATGTSVGGNAVVQQEPQPQQKRPSKQQSQVQTSPPAPATLDSLVQPQQGSTRPERPLITGQQQQHETSRQIPAGGEEGQQQQQQLSREAAPADAAAPVTSAPTAGAQL
ncbi:hypothetical protein DFJ73DRAFT_786419 [Zopfochytrium polystomum]|nr:hypothetical protein DFJ73DRAFT_786419 [Zopfochytrium polystomum]